MPIRLGQPVYARHKNCRYYKAVVDRIEDKICYWVEFVDEDSFSKDISPEDLIVSNFN